MSKIALAVVFAAVTTTIEGAEQGRGPRADALLFGKGNDKFGDKARDKFSENFGDKARDKFSSEKNFDGGELRDKLGENNYGDKLGKAGFDRKNFTVPRPKPDFDDKPGDFNTTEFLHNRSVKCNETRKTIAHVKTLTVPLKEAFNTTNVTLSVVKEAVRDFIGGLKEMTTFNFTKWEEFLQARKVGDEWAAEGWAMSIEVAEEAFCFLHGFCDYVDC